MILNHIFATRRVSEEYKYQLHLAQNSVQINTLEGYVPLAYEDYHSLAPGITLIKAPGHSPGSQVILLTLASGNEFLFVGDIAWHRDNIDLVRTRARCVSFLLEEDPGAVLQQLKTFTT